MKRKTQGTKKAGSKATRTLAPKGVASKHAAKVKGGVGVIRKIGG